MLEDIKKELISHPEKLKDVLEHYDYHNIVIHNTYMSFGRSEESSKKSIVIRLKDNDFIWVTDYARNIGKDLFAYIIDQRKVEFSHVLNTVKNVLGITDYYDFFDSKRCVFGGFYEKIRKKNLQKINVYDESILKDYQRCGNLRFVKDNISLESQKFFNIRYDVESQGIVIPIYDQIGQLMGAKVRCNYEVADGEMKYYYLLPCQASKTMFGFSHNYNYLMGNTIYVGESEKFVMQCYTYGYRNALGLMSGSLSADQARMLVGLSPQKVIFLHDNDYPIENIMNNIKKLKEYSRFSEFDIGYWDWRQCNYKEKVSPTDMGRKEFEKIISTQIVYVKKGDDDGEIL